MIIKEEEIFEKCQVSNGLEPRKLVQFNHIHTRPHYGSQLSCAPMKHNYLHIRYLFGINFRQEPHTWWQCVLYSYEISTRNVTLMSW